MLFRQVEQVQSESHRHQPCIQKLKSKKYPKLKFRKRDHFSFVLLGRGANNQNGNLRCFLAPQGALVVVTV